MCLDPVDVGISRIAGSVEHNGGTWWIINRSSTRPITVIDELGLRTVVAPARRLAAAGPMTIIVEGSARRHAIEVLAEHPDLAPAADPLTGDAMPTLTADDVIVNDADRRALVALFSGYLEPFPRHDPHPRSYADAAETLGWPRSTLVKRIEYLRTRLTSAGVPNLVGETALEHLAEWAITTGVITRADLALIGRARDPGNL